MPYELSKAKKYILIGAGAIVLAVLAVVAAPLLYRQKYFQDSVSNLSPQEKLEQEKIKKEFEKLEVMREDAGPFPTEEQIKNEFDALEKQRTEVGATPPTPEQIQAEFEKLEQMRK